MIGQKGLKISVKIVEIEKMFLHSIRGISYNVIILKMINRQFDHFLAILKATVPLIIKHKKHLANSTYYKTFFNTINTARKP